MTEMADGFDHDAALLACANGQTDALRALYQHESRWLLGVALRIVRNRAAAEDVLHDAFLLIWRNAGSFNPQLGSGRGWIYTVVRHRALTEARKNGRDVALDDNAMDALAQAADSNTSDSAHTTLGLTRCLQQLEAQRRACIVHAFVDGYTHEQIAQRMNAPLGTVKSWIRRALMALKECLS